MTCEERTRFKTWLKANGVSIGDWAAQNGFKAAHVYTFLNGRTNGNSGTSSHIAEAVKSQASLDDAVPVVPKEDSEVSAAERLRLRAWFKASERPIVGWAVEHGFNPAEVHAFLNNVAGGGGRASRAIGAGLRRLGRPADQADDLASASEEALSPFDERLRLKAWLKASGRPIAEWAEENGLSPGYVYVYLSGVGHGHSGEARRIAEAIRTQGAPASWIDGKTDPSVDRTRARLQIEASGLSVTKWADRHGLSLDSVYAYLNGRTNGSKGQGHLVAMALKQDAESKS